MHFNLIFLFLTFNNDTVFHHIGQFDLAFSNGTIYNSIYLILSPLYILNSCELGIWTQLDPSFLFRLCIVQLHLKGLCSLLCCGQ